MPFSHKSRSGSSKKKEKVPFTGCYGSITREQLRELDEQIARESAIRAQWCYICSLAYVPRLKNPSFPAAVGDSGYCADHLEEAIYRLLNWTLRHIPSTGWDWDLG